MSAFEGQVRRGEAAGELRYLSIKLLGYVAELPSRSLPPRGRVPWSAADLVELRRLASAANTGEADAALAVDALDAIDEAFQRGVTDPASDTGVADEAARLVDYQSRRDVAMKRLPRLHPHRVERGPAVTGSRPSLWAQLRTALSRLSRGRDGS